MSICTNCCLPSKHLSGLFGNGFISPTPWFVAKIEIPALESFSTKNITLLEIYIQPLRWSNIATGRAISWRKYTRERREYAFSQHPFSAPFYPVCVIESVGKRYRGRSSSTGKQNNRPNYSRLHSKLREFYFTSLLQVQTFRFLFHFNFKVWEDGVGVEIFGVLELVIFVFF